MKTRIMFKPTFLNKSTVFRLSFNKSCRSIFGGRPLHDERTTVERQKPSINQSNDTSQMTVFSGIQPTGQIHLGNYFGAIDVWRQLTQRRHVKCIFSLVDLHSITTKYDPKQLRHNIYQQLACLLAAGLDPSKCILFRQSDVNHHGQLAWILGCQLTLTKLNCLPQFKVRAFSFFPVCSIGL